MKTKSNVGKIWAAVFVVTLFLISSIGPVNAGLLDYQTKSIEKSGSNDSETGTADQKPIPTLDDADSNDISVANDNLNQIDSQQLQGQSYQQPSIPKKYAVIVVGRYFGLWRWTYLLKLTVFLEIVQQYYTWYLNDAGRLYTTLRDTYGYDDDHIFLLVKLLPDDIYFQGQRYFIIPNATFNTSWNDYDNVIGNNIEEKLQNVLNTFKSSGENKLTEQDQLFFCFIDHGGNIEENYAGNDLYVNEFISPNNYNNTNWVNEFKANDSYYNSETHRYYHNTGTSAVFKRAQNGWSDPLILTLDEPEPIKGFRINAKKGDNLDKMIVALYNGSTLVNPNEYMFTNWPDNGYKYVEFENMPSTPFVDKVKIWFHENASDYTGFLFHQAKVYDFNFWKSDSCGEVGSATFFGCPFQTIPEVLQWIFGNSFVESLCDYELFWYTWNISAKIIFALQPCMSGGFMSELSGDNRIVCTASRGFELAVASWIGCFRNALNKYDGEDPDNLPDADYNNDTKISILEAYRYAAEKVEEQLNTHPEFPPQHPLIDDNDDGIGHHFYETNYYGNSSGKDGYLADQTFL